MALRAWVTPAIAVPTFGRSRPPIGEVWNARAWILAGGKLLRDDRFRQLTWIKYKVTTDKVIQIEPKVELKKRTGKSPDFAERLMLTFTQGPPEPRVR